MSATATHLLLHNKWAHDVVRPLASNVSPLIPGTKAPKFLMISEGCNTLNPKPGSNLGYGPQGHGSVYFS
jgi:hypothetical protein